MRCPALSTVAVVAAAIVALQLTACGRLGFGSSPDGAAAIDAVPFQPAVGGCLQANAGPFTDLATFPTQGGGFGLWIAPPHILEADMAGGVHDLTFDGTAFTELGSIDTVGWAEAVWSDGSDVFVGAPGTGLAVLALGGDGSLTMRAQDTTTANGARDGRFANGMLFVPTGSTGLYAYLYDGTSLTAQMSTPSMGWADGVWVDGSRVLFGDSVLRMLDFDGTTFTDVIPALTDHLGSSRIWSDGSIVFVANNDGATAYRMAGATLTELSTYAIPAGARDVWSDGQHVFVATNDGSLDALALTGDQLALVDQVVVGTQALGVFGDGTFIYANDLTGGVHAYSGFACLSW